MSSRDVGGSWSWTSGAWRTPTPPGGPREPTRSSWRECRLQSWASDPWTEALDANAWWTTWSWSVVAASAAEEGALDADHADIGLTGVWAKYDRSMIKDFVVEPAPEQSWGRRHMLLGKAFQNYRRTVLNHLKRWKLKKQCLCVWRKVAKSSAAGSAAHVKADCLDLLWTDAHMEHFLNTYASFEAQVQHRTMLQEARQDPKHKHHGTPLPRLIPPSLVKLWQICLAQAHSKFYTMHFGDMSVHRLVYKPLAVRAEDADLSFEMEQISDLQVQAFDEDWVRALDSLGQLSQAQQKTILAQMRSYSGAKLWQYTLELTNKAAPRSRRRVAFEQITARMLRESMSKGPLHQEAASASLPVTPSAVPTAAETAQHVLENLDVKSGCQELDEAVAQNSQRQHAQRDGSFCDEVFQNVQRHHQHVVGIVAASAADILQQLDEFEAWRLQEVIGPCIEWVQFYSAGWAPKSISTFGSSCYGLPLPSSDFDICVTLPVGRSDKEMLLHCQAAAKMLAARGEMETFSAVASAIPPSTNTLQLKYRGIPVDIFPTKEARSTKAAVVSTDMLKYMLEQRDGKPGFRQSIRLFKLIAHHLKIIAWHGKGRGDKFKAIALSFFCVAMLDGLPAVSDEVVGSAAANYLMVLIAAFLGFRFDMLQVFVGKDGSTRVEKKTYTCVAVNVYVEGQGSNVCSNVSAEHVAQSREKLSKFPPALLVSLLRDAMWTQDIKWRRILVEQRPVHDEIRSRWLFPGPPPGPPTGPPPGPPPDPAVIDSAAAPPGLSPDPADTRSAAAPPGPREIQPWLAHLPHRSARGWFSCRTAPSTARSAPRAHRGDLAMCWRHRGRPRFLATGHQATV